MKRNHRRAKSILIRKLGSLPDGLCDPLLHNFNKQPRKNEKLLILIKQEVGTDWISHMFILSVFFNLKSPNEDRVKRVGGETAQCSSVHSGLEKAEEDLGYGALQG